MSKYLNIENFGCAFVSDVLVSDISKTQITIKYMCVSGLATYHVKKNDEIVWEGYSLKDAIEVYNSYV